MMTQLARILLPAAVAMLVVFSSAGCSKKPKPVVTPPTTQAPEATPDAGTVTPPVETPSTSRADLKDVFFDYDRHTIRVDQQDVLRANGKILVDDPAISVLLEGHCDERGTVEYNLALGERRARAARDYLVQYGVEAGRISTISYGEERPFAAGHDESAWALNRRVHVVPR